ncbi:hypothetical protein UVI_02029830 [Ustilaginoidea virens]|uniref:C2H2-type domain-containing protein n=1 Tax=Ustilaginoidea virens TaxID=1159556 RepID=A0A1B5L5N5_USTVR|nr:hypothetical protein UVI_02029830 [Ustilaginoidea virens]
MPSSRYEYNLDSSFSGSDVTYPGMEPQLSPPGSFTIEDCPELSQPPMPADLSYDLHNMVAWIRGGASEPMTPSGYLPDYYTPLEDGYFFAKNDVPTTPSILSTPTHDRKFRDCLSPVHFSASAVTPPRFSMHSVSPWPALDSSPFAVTPADMHSDTEASESPSSWNYSSQSFLSPYTSQTAASEFSDPDSLGMASRSSLPLATTSYPETPESKPLPSQREKALQEIQHKTAMLQYSQNQGSSSTEPGAAKEVATIDVVQQRKSKCDVSGCNKVFCRTEHLKRHKKTHHGLGLNRFACEFCGKNQFNRRDNLNSHRKLHARPSRKNRGVMFVPAAMTILEQERRSRKTKAPSKPKDKPVEKEELCLKRSPSFV